MARLKDYHSFGIKVVGLVGGFLVIGGLELKVYRGLPLWGLGQGLGLGIGAGLRNSFALVL